MFMNKEGKLRSGWNIAAMIGTAFLATIILGCIIGVFFVFYYIAKFSSAGSMGIESMMKDLESLSQGDSILSQIMIPIQAIIFMIIPVIAWKFIRKRPLSNMGLTKFKKDSKDFYVGLLFGIVSITVVFLFLIVTDAAKVTTWKPYFSVSQLFYILVFICVGFSEEIFARGYIMSTLRQTKNVYVAVFVSAIIFALMHSTNSGISIIAYLNLTLVGVLFAYMYLKSGNIWMCIGYHITWNYFQGCVYGFQVSGQPCEGIITTQNNGNNMFNGGAFGPEGGLFVTLVILIGLLFVKQYYKNNTYDFISSEPSTIVNDQISYNPQLQNDSSSNQ